MELCIFVTFLAVKPSLQIAPGMLPSTTCKEGIHNCFSEEQVCIDLLNIYDKNVLFFFLQLFDHVRLVEETGIASKTGRERGAATVGCCPEWTGSHLYHRE